MPRKKNTKPTLPAGDKFKAAAVLTADVGGVAGLAKIVHIPNSYVSLFLIAVLWLFSVWVVREYLKDNPQ